MFSSFRPKNTIDNVYVQPTRTFSFPPFGMVIAATLSVFIVACGSGGSSAAAPAATIVATPSISVPTGTYNSAQQVTITDATSGSAIYYTTNGAIPTSSSTIYQAPIPITVSSTVQAIAVLNGTQSAVATSTLTINLPPQAAMLAFVQQPTSAPVGSTIAPAVGVAVEDSNGNPVTAATNPVTLALVGGSGLTGTLTVVPQNGVATFSNLSIGTAGSGYTLAATSPGLGSATSASFAITPIAPVAAKLAFSQQPANALTGAPITPAITVTVEDTNGNPVTTASNSVTLALISGAGLGGTLMATPSNGVTTFSNVTESTAGTYMLSATSAGLVPATSAGFSITAPINNGTTILQTMPGSITAFPGGTFELTYNWLAAPVAPQSSVFVDFIDSKGTIQYQDNSQPPVSTSQWAGPVSYTRTLTVPATAALGKYSIVAGLQTANGNISLVAGPGVTSLPDATYRIGTVVLAPACSIASFGAKGDGVTDNLTAIQNAFNYAAANQCVAVIPGGTFAYSGNITATGIAVMGTGAASILEPLSLSNQALILAGSGSSLSNFVMKSSAVSRLDTPQSAMIWANNASNYVVENVLVNGSSSVGIFSLGCNNGEILNNTVENTLADSISQSDGTYNIVISGNRIVNSGDDGVSNNSYFGDPGGMVHDITVQGNTVLSNVTGRGLEVSGGSDITFTGNYVDNTDGFADMYIASELPAYDTVGVDSVTVSANSFADGGPAQGSLLISNSQGTAYNITNITVSGNQFINPKLTSVQYTGNGIESGTVDNNTAYTNNSFSSSSNSNATFTQSANQVLAPSTFTTPLVPAGGGCNFSGC